MKDITGRLIKIGDFIVVGKRSGNSGTLDIGVVYDIKKDRICIMYETNWNGGLSKGGTKFPQKTAIIDSLEDNENNKRLIELQRDIIAGVKL